MPHPIEVHLQSGFSGQRVVVELDGRPLADVVARTPLQLGLAHRLELQADAGQVLTVGLPEHRLRSSFTIGDEDETITVNYDGTDLRLDTTRGPVSYF